MPSTPETNIVLFVGLTPALLGPIQALKKKKGVNYRYAIIHDTKTPTPEQKEVLDVFDIEIKTNFSSRDTLTKSLQPYEHELLAITSRSESNIPYFQKVIPHVPYLRTPTTESLTWATEKLKMRQQLNSYDKNIGPAFMIVHDSAKKTIKEIEEKVGFPVVIKPTGLVRGLLVTAAYHHEELEKELNRVFWKINKLHRDTNGRGEPSVLVEQLMDGEMYSVDAHVTSRGTIHFNPFVHVKTGRSIGFDDFFSYQQITPTRLNKQSVADAQEVTEKAIRALGLRSTTAHVELLKTEDGWKVIEVGPRIGGFRHVMYNLSYGIDITENDIRTRIPRPITIPRTVKGHTALIKIYAPKEGVITKITGAKKAQQLKSFHSISVHKQIGDRAYFAKNGGRDIFHVTFFNKDRPKLLADIRRFEKMVEITTK